MRDVADGHDDVGGRDMAKELFLRTREMELRGVVFRENDQVDRARRLRRRLAEMAPHAAEAEPRAGTASLRPLMWLVLHDAPQPLNRVSSHCREAMTRHRTGACQCPIDPDPPSEVA